MQSLLAKYEHLPDASSLAYTMPEDQKTMPSLEGNFSSIKPFPETNLANDLSQLTDMMDLVVEVGLEDEFPEFSKETFIPHCFTKHM